MKTLNTILMAFLCLIFNIINAQNSIQCIHCNMNIQDKLHIASAKLDNESINFDAIECLINYLKNNNGLTIIEVSDYISGTLTNATTATYLKSKAIPSPMGANLSAFKNKKDALKFQEEKGGIIYSWEEIKNKFENSKIGLVEHSHHDHYRPDAHAPIGIMGDHLHPKGDLMLSLRHMNMVMDGNKSGTVNIDDATIYNNFMVAPQSMTMNMYMLGMMYAPSDKLTVMIMQNISKKDMDLTASMIMNNMPLLRNFSTTSSGLGDLKIGAIYSLFNNYKTSLHLNGFINTPIGDIENRDDTPMATKIKLPYAMQLGSGTFDVTFGVTYKENYTIASWGTQVLSTFRTGENKGNYRFGNVHQLNIWYAYKLSTNFSVSARVLVMKEGTLKGIDGDLNPMMVTTANVNNYGSDKIKSFIGLNIAFPEASSFKDFRLGIEAGSPIYENYNGIQMNENLTINFGIKYNAL